MLGTSVGLGIGLDYDDPMASLVWERLGSPRLVPRLSMASEQEVVGSTRSSPCDVRHEPDSRVSSTDTHSLSSPGELSDTEEGATTSGVTQTSLCPPGHSSTGSPQATVKGLEGMPWVEKPEGMSKNQWKKKLRQQCREKMKPEWK